MQYKRPYLADGLADGYEKNYNWLPAIGRLFRQNVPAGQRGVQRLPHYPNSTEGYGPYYYAEGLC
jgi:hypothetical protein